MVQRDVRLMRKRGVQDSYDLLTEREREILQLLAEGQSNKEAAAVLNLSPYTVETHRTNMMQKLGLHNTAEIVLYAVREGIITRCWRHRRFALARFSSAFHAAGQFARSSIYRVIAPCQYWVSPCCFLYAGPSVLDPLLISIRVNSTFRGEMRMNSVLAAPASERVLPDDNSAQCMERSSTRDNRMA